MFISKNKLLIGASLAFAVFSAGCTTSKFTCPGPPETGIKCSSVSEVYSKAISGGISSPRAAGQTGSPGADDQNALPETLTKGEAMVRQLEQDKQIPLRIPPKIISIWVAPWEDDDGDLNQGGFIYSEVSDPRNKWIMGEKLPINKQQMKLFTGRIPSPLSGRNPLPSTPNNPLSASPSEIKKPGRVNSSRLIVKDKATKEREKELKTKMPEQRDSPYNPPVLIENPSQLKESPETEDSSICEGEKCHATQSINTGTRDN